MKKKIHIPEALNPLTDDVPSPVTIVAEIGCNHQGSLELANQLIDVATRFCGVTQIKSQKRTNSVLADTVEYSAPHPVPENSFGSTYYEHRESLELSTADHQAIRQRAQDLGSNYFLSVWDLNAAREVASAGFEDVKIPASRNHDVRLLEYCCETFPGIIHISLGMTTCREREEIVHYVDKYGRLEDSVIYHCTSGYPIEYEDVCLLDIQDLAAQYGDHVRAIGYSGHHAGIAVDMAAIALGATWIERHYTLDRTLKGTDHAASLEPDGLRRLRRDATATTRSMSRKPSDKILEIELAQRIKLRVDPLAESHL